ncbi:MAG: U32 family peptidase, partial [Treponema sp.]|nr:U32 family peptidase [Treponema sp.]
LPADYDFTYFTDKEGMEFKAIATNDGSIVMPESPFSVTDKVDIINKNGFNRILLDFSHTALSKQELKLVTTSMVKLQPVQDASRFNWKDGFYSPEKMEAYKAMNERQAELRETERFDRKFRGKGNRLAQARGKRGGSKGGRGGGFGGRKR